MKYFYTEKEFFDCKICIESLLAAVDMNKKIYKHIPYIDNYFENWKLALYHTYISEFNKTCFIGNQKIFWESIFIGSSEMRFHFDIDKAINFAYNQQSQELPLNMFTTKKTQNSDAFIKYTIPSTLNFVNEYSACEKPIILVSLLHCGLRYLVIDGNHRVSARKKQNIPSINGILLPPDCTEQLFYSNFEKAIYIFLYEGILLEEQNDLNVIRYSNSKRFFNI